MQEVKEHIATKKLVPQLRFNEFDGEWERNYVNELASKLKVGFVGTCEPYYTTSEEGVLLVRTGNLKGVHIELDEEKYVTRAFHDKNKKSQIYPGDLLLARHGGNGEICRVPEDFPTANCLNIVILRTNSELKSEYFQLVYSSFAVQKQISAVTAGSTQVVINTKEIGKLKIVYPSLPEQQKIASFLSAVDEKIQQLTKKKALLEQYKKGVMQQLFSGQLRFKDENGNSYPDWEEKRLGEYLIHKSTRNKDLSVELVLSVSNKKGFISQEEQFDGYEVASKDVSNYKIVDRDDIAYNPSRINVGSIARLINFEQGIVSPMYVIFSLKNGLNKIFFENLYNTHRFKHLIKVGCSGSVRDSLNFDDLCDFEFKFPSIEEQQKIARYLSSIDTKIEAVNNQITQTQTFKKGLSQQMFV